MVKKLSLFFILLTLLFLLSPKNISATTVPALYFRGSEKISPDENGKTAVLIGSEINIILSISGNPTSVQVVVEDKSFDLNRIQTSSLWQGQVSFEKKGQEKFQVLSKDSRGRQIIEEQNHPEVIGAGKVVNSANEPIQKAEITLYRFVESLSTVSGGEWQVWNGQDIKQENPQNTDKKGQFYLFLPQGKYIIRIEKSGYQKFESAPIVIDKPTVINPVLTLQKEPTIAIFSKSIKVNFLSNLIAKRQEIYLPKQEEVILSENIRSADFTLPTTSGEKITLSSYSGNKVLLTFLTTWDSQSLDQILILEEYLESDEITILPVALGESKEKLEKLTKKGNYKLDILVDEKSITLNKYKITNIPQHILINEKGEIEKVRFGLFTRQDILELIK